jgi:hypothetical protein
VVAKWPKAQDLRSCLVEVRRFKSCPLHNNNRCRIEVNSTSLWSWRSAGSNPPSGIMAVLNKPVISAPSVSDLFPLVVSETLVGDWDKIQFSTYSIFEKGFSTRVDLNMGRHRQENSPKGEKHGHFILFPGEKDKITTQNKNRCCGDPPLPLTWTSILSSPILLFLRRKQWI